MNSQFRSNLMRQIVATARHQARPPVALMGWISNELDDTASNNNMHGTGHVGVGVDALAVGSGFGSASGAAPAVRLRRRTSPGGTERYEYCLPILSSSVCSEGPGCGSPAAAQHPMSAAALGSAAADAASSSSSTSAAAGSSSLYVLPAPSSAVATAASMDSEKSPSSSSLDAPFRDDAVPTPVVAGHEDHGDFGGASDPDAAARRSTSEATPPTDNDKLPQLFQNLILTRRTRSHFAPRNAPSGDADGADGTSRIDNSSRAFWTEALDRAVTCGYAAPNHRRTEPFTFRRLLAPSARTRGLADVAYQVQLRKLRRQREERHRRPPENGVSGSTLADDKEEEEEDWDTKSARRKHDKWNSIPAFLVATVKSPSQLLQSSEDSSRESDGHKFGAAAPRYYEPLEYVPPATIRELEDYASCCAAVQNVLLSLHSEGIATKWATGDVVRTPAFLDLIEIPRDERVVALVQVGHPASPTSSSSSAAAAELRRHRRPLQGDVLLDL